MTLAARLTRALTDAGIAVVGVSIGNPSDKTTWKVQPANLQSAAQPIINAFDPTDPAHEAADLTAEAVSRLDQERIFSALVWAIVDTYSAPATVTKYNAARTKIVNAYKTQPWKP